MPVYSGDLRGKGREARGYMSREEIRSTVINSSLFYGTKLSCYLFLRKTVISILVLANFQIHLFIVFSFCLERLG